MIKSCVRTVQLFKTWCSKFDIQRNRQTSGTPVSVKLALCGIQVTSPSSNVSSILCSIQSSLGYLLMKKTFKIMKHKDCHRICCEGHLSLLWEIFLNFHVLSNNHHQLRRCLTPSSLGRLGVSQKSRLV